MNFFPVNPNDFIARKDSGFFGRRAFHQLLHHRLVGAVKSHHYKGKDKCQNKIEKWPRKYSRNPGPYICFQKRVFVCFPVFRHHTVFTVEHTGAAYREQFQRVLCLSFPERKKCRSHAHRKFHDTDSISFANQKMSELMGYYYNSKDNQK